MFKRVLTRRSTRFIVEMWKGRSASTPQISPFTCIWCTLSANSWRLSLSSASIASIPKYTTSFWVSLVAWACFWMTSLITELTAIAVLVFATKNNQLWITFLDVSILSQINYNNVWQAIVNHAIVWKIQRGDRLTSGQLRSIDLLFQNLNQILNHHIKSSS